MPEGRSGRATDPERSRLRWRCRRGMKELDLLLLAWLDTAFDDAGNEQRACFAALLELSDPQLVRYLAGAERPGDAAQAALVEAIAGIMTVKPDEATGPDVPGGPDAPGPGAAPVGPGVPAGPGAAGGSGTFERSRGQKPVPVSLTRGPRQLP